MLTNVVPASALIGELVHSHDGLVTGQIEEILLDTEACEIAFALISLEPESALEKVRSSDWIAIPWKGIRVDLSRGGDGFIVDSTGANLKSAPSFKKENWPNFADPQFQLKVLQHFGLHARTHTSRAQGQRDLQ